MTTNDIAIVGRAITIAINIVGRAIPLKKTIKKRSKGLIPKNNIDLIPGILRPNH